MRALTSLALLLVFGAAPAQAYITYPVVTLGSAVAESTYVTVLKVEKVSRENGVIVYSKVRDLKGKYPKDKLRHVFDLKNTPAHKGSGDVPIRPDEKDWKHAIAWAEPGKIAVMFTRKYDPFGDFGHTYIDGCWYATMCPPRDWEFWYAIYSDPKLLERWYAGTPSRLISALESVIADREVLVPALGKGTRDDLRTGKAKVQGLRVSLALRDFVPARDIVTDPVDAAAIPDLVKALPAGTRDARLKVIRSLCLFGPASKSAVAPLSEIVRNDPSGTLRIAAADALAAIGPDAKPARDALLAGAKDPRMAARKDVFDRLNQVAEKLK